MRALPTALLFVLLPSLSTADSVAGHFDVAQQCAELTEYVGRLGTLAGVQSFERTKQLNELVKLRQEYQLVYTTSRIVLGATAMDVLSDESAGIRELERDVLACVNLEDCDPSGVAQSAETLSEALIAACQEDFKGSH